MTTSTNPGSRRDTALARNPPDDLCDGYATSTRVDPRIPCVPVTDKADKASGAASLRTQRTPPPKQRAAPTDRLALFLRRAEGIMERCLENIQRVDRTMSEMEQQQRAMSEQQHALNRDRDQLLNEVSDEHARLAHALREQERLHREKCKAHEQRVQELQLSATRGREECDARVEFYDQKVKELHDQMRDLQYRLREAVASRDRIAHRVRDLEQAFNATVMSLRRQLEASTCREDELREQVEAAHRDVAALKILGSTPSINDATVIEEPTGTDERLPVATVSLAGQLGSVERRAHGDASHVHVPPQRPTGLK